MALLWLQRVELALFAAAFMCGAVAAATLTRTQVRLRGGVRAGRVGGEPAEPDSRPLVGRRGRPGAAGAGRLRKRISANSVLWVRLPRTYLPYPRQRDKLSGVTYSTRHSPDSWLLLHNLTLVLKQVGPGPAAF